MLQQYGSKIMSSKWLLICLFWIICQWTWFGASASGNGELSLETRVAARRAIEEVYWKHTLWPEANTSPKPQLSEVVSDEELRNKVTETLRMSKALEIIWKQPVTGYQLQAEVERMAATTRDAGMLREL